MTIIPGLVLSIPRRSRHCMEHGELFQPNTDYVSMIIDGKESYERKDFCVTCWEANKAKWIPISNSVWKAKTNGPKTLSELSKRKDERALALLQTMIGEDVPDIQAEAFVLALYLVRKKVIVWRQDLIQNDQTYLMYEVCTTEEMLLVRKISLSQLQVSFLQKRLAEKLA